MDRGSKMTVYYNEIDPYAAQWLRNLMAAGHIAEGEVDERSITEVQPDDLLGFDQCHFFAGIGVWSHALRRAGWADDRPIWTGSCPCQPFSAAGQQRGFDDERHLWPVWFNLIRQCRPPVVLGEQVASALDWLDLVSADMEASDYAFGASDLCAAGFGGAHIRQRLYFVGMAHSKHAGSQGRICRGPDAQRQNINGHAGCSSAVGGLADTPSCGQQYEPRPEPAGVQSEAAGNSFAGAKPCGYSARVGHGYAPLLGWDAVDWLYCQDGKWRPVEPSTFPLVDAPTSRVGRLRAYGNGLDAETATQFVAAVRDCAP